jgi:hypothetical protein
MTIIKVIGILLYFIVTIITSYIPVWDKNHALSKRYLSLCRVFTRGVFLATTLLYFIP